MGQAIALLAPVAFGVALSPIPVAEFLLILLSRRARTNGLVFVVTSLVLLTVVPLVAALTLEVSTDTASSAPSTARSWIFVVLGLILLLLAARKFRQRDKEKVPAVFDKIAGMGPGAVLVLVPGATVLDPKNLALLLSAGSQLEALDLAGCGSSSRRSFLPSSGRRRTLSRSRTYSCAWTGRPSCSSGPSPG